MSQEQTSTYDALSTRAIESLPIRLDARDDGRLVVSVVTHFDPLFLAESPTFRDWVRDLSGACPHFLMLVAPTHDGVAMACLLALCESLEIKRTSNELFISDVVTARVKRLDLSRVITTSCFKSLDQAHPLGINDTLTLIKRNGQHIKRCMAMMRYSKRVTLI